MLRHLSSPKAFKINSFSVKRSLQKDDVAKSFKKLIKVFTHQYHLSYFIKQSTLLKLSMPSLIKILPSLCNLDERCYSTIENFGWKNLVMKSLMSQWDASFVKNCYEKRERWLVPWRWTKHITKFFRSWNWAEENTNNPDFLKLRT